MSDHEYGVLGGGGSNSFYWEPQSWNLFIANLSKQRGGEGGASPGGNSGSNINNYNNNLDSSNVKAPVRLVISSSTEEGSAGNNKTGAAAVVVVRGEPPLAGGSKKQRQVEKEEYDDGGGGDSCGSGLVGGGMAPSRRVVKRMREEERRAHIMTERERRKRMRDMFDELHCMLPHLPSKIDKATIVDETAKYIKTLEEFLHTLQKQKHDKQRLRASTLLLPPTPSSSSSSPSLFANQQQSSFINDIKPGLITNLGVGGGVADPSTFSAPTSFAVQVSGGFIKSASGSTTSSPRDSPVVFHTWTSPNIVVNTCGNDAQIVICSPRKPGLLTSIVLLLDKFKIEVESVLVSSDDGNQCLYCMIQARLQGSGGLFSAEGVYKQAATEMTFLL